MGVIEVSEVSFRYDAEASPALDSVSLCVFPGERHVLLGRNGSGKSTLARLLNGSLLPDAGRVAVDGMASSSQTARDFARRVGLVRQDPRNQLVSSLVEDEVAFGPCNLGLPREEVLERVHWALEVCGIEHLTGRMTSELSGGQQQLLAIAGVVAMRPDYLVLDEAGSQLDGDARSHVGALVDRLVSQGMGVLQIEHAAEPVASAHAVTVLDEGRVAWSGNPQEFFASPAALEAAGLDGDAMAHVLSCCVRSGFALGGQDDVEELASFARERGLGGALLATLGGGSEDGALTGETALAGGHELELARARVRYGNVGALEGVSLKAGGACGLTLLLGRSGSGKTTAARVMSGVQEPDGGQALLDGRQVEPGEVGLAFQRPEDQLFANTVLEDIEFGPASRGLDSQEAEQAARDAARELGVDEGLLERSPFELSGGQMRRVALAGVVAARPAAYVFDEPTAGLDGPARDQLHGLLEELCRHDNAVVVISHDAGEWLLQAREVVFLHDGKVVARASGRRASRDVSLYEAAGLEPPFEVRLRAALEDRHE